MGSESEKSTLKFNSYTGRKSVIGAETVGGLLFSGIYNCFAEMMQRPSFLVKCEGLMLG